MTSIIITVTLIVALLSSWIKYSNLLRKYDQQKRVVLTLKEIAVGYGANSKYLSHVIKIVDGENA